MRIAILQFAPTLGAVPSNLARADALLAAASARLTDIDLLLLPELAFTGYNFQSAEEIEPFLERRGEGESAGWARRTAARLGAVVGVGYAERGGEEGEGEGEEDDCNDKQEEQRVEEVKSESGHEREKGPATANSRGTRSDRDNNNNNKHQPRNYNSLLAVCPTGHTLAHYRKTHLYTTDESWAHESPSGWLTLDLPLPITRRPPHSPSPPTTTKTAFAICMDLNPHQFTAPPRAYELATHVLRSRARLLLCSMAWLTHLPRADLFARDVRARPDMATVAWWVGRLRPLCGNWGGGDGEERAGGTEGEVVVVVANRSGEEAGGGGARYAGSSCVLGLGGEGVRCWGILGRGEEGVLVVDTGGEAGWRIGGWEGGDEDGDEEGEEGEEGEDEDEV